MDPISAIPVTSVATDASPATGIVAQSNADAFAFEQSLEQAESAFFVGLILPNLSQVFDGD